MSTPLMETGQPSICTCIHVDFMAASPVCNTPTSRSAVVTITLPGAEHVAEAVTICCAQISDCWASGLKGVGPVGGFGQGWAAAPGGGGPWWWHAALILLLLPRKEGARVAAGHAVEEEEPRGGQGRARGGRPGRQRARALALIPRPSPPP